MLKNALAQERQHADRRFAELEDRMQEVIDKVAGNPLAHECI